VMDSKSDAKSSKGTKTLQPFHAISAEEQPLTNRLLQLSVHDPDTNVPSSTIPTNGNKSHAQQLFPDSPILTARNSPLCVTPLRGTTYESSSSSFASTPLRDTSPKQQQRAFELTPVMRNTTETQQQESDHKTMNNAWVVTPQHDESDALHLRLPDPAPLAECRHFSFPKMLASSKSYSFATNHHMNNHMNNTTMDELNYSFDDDEDLFVVSSTTAAYMPTERLALDDDECDAVAQPPCDDIFVGRRVTDEDKHHRLVVLQQEEIDETTSAAVATMGERTWSIPSLHMANDVVGTDTEEDSTCDASASSSLGSSLYVRESTCGPQPVALPPRSIFTPELLLHTTTTTTTCSPNNTEDDEELFKCDAKNSNVSTAHVGRRNNKRKQKAFAWLHSLEQDGAVVEAASSKFLTGRANVLLQPMAQRVSMPTTSTKSTSTVATLD
jgi:hypothetical protein